MRRPGGCYNARNVKTAMCGMVVALALAAAGCGSSSLGGAGGASGAGGPAGAGAAGAGGAGGHAGAGGAAGSAGAGAAGAAGSAGAGAAGVAGSAGGAGGAGGHAGGAGGQAGGAGAAGRGCPASLDFHDTTGGLQLGPHNHVFVDPMIDTQPVKNYASQVIFAGPTLSIVANFPKDPNIGFDGGAKTDIVPDAAALDAGSALDPWLGELSLLPAGCAPSSLAGKSVEVRLLWVLNGAIGTSPLHTVALGTIRNGAEVQYADAQLVYPSTRSLNTLTPVVLTHTFVDPQDGSGGLFLRIYVADPIEQIPTTVYLDAITWTDATTDGSAGGG